MTDKPNPFARKLPVNQPDPVQAQALADSAPVQLRPSEEAATPAAPEPPPAAPKPRKPRKQPTASKPEEKPGNPVPDPSDLELQGKEPVQIYVSKEFKALLDHLKQTEERPYTFLIRRHLDLGALIKKAADSGFYDGAGEGDA